MSTKIYDGWKTEDIGQLLLDVTKVAEPLLKDAVLKVVEDRIKHRFTTAEEIDAIEAKAPEQLNNWALYDVAAEILTEFRAQTPKLEHNSDDLSIGLIARIKGTTTYFYTWAGMGILSYWKWNDVLGKLPLAIPYPYWNDTDHPDDISDEEWNVRGDIWHKVLDYPALRFDLLSPDEFRHYIPFWNQDQREQLLPKVPGLLRSARLIVEVNQVFTKERHLGKEACIEKCARLYREAGEGFSKWAFEWGWDYLERQEAKAKETPVSTANDVV